MPIYVLADTPAGYGLFESSDKKLLKRNDLPTELKKTEKVLDLLKLKSFTQYGSAAIALEEAAALAKGTVPPLLSSLLEEMGKEAKATVAVADMKLANAISQVPQFDVKAVAGSNLGFLYRAIREHLTSLAPGMTFDDYDRLVLGLGHSISRHKIKFSADKIDSMVCHTVKILDDVDRETNVFAMRLKEWYNWHFPELFKLLNDNLLYARVILAAGRRPNYAETDLSEILTEEIETVVQETAKRSMGTDLGDGDLENCRLMAGQVVKFMELRRELSSYLESRMQAIAPNLTALVGFLVGARLIAHVGTVTGLAKSAASTIQILGAEKALFRALKTKHDTPKYGLIYHSSLVGQATGKNKGKMARMLAAKAALGVRVDALSEDKEDEEYEQRASLGLTNRLKLENNLRKLEGRPRLPDGVGIGPDGQVLGPGQLTLRETRRYNADADGVTNGAPEPKSKSNGVSKKSGKLVEVVESKDIEMGDGDDSDDEMGDVRNAPRSPALASVSDDTEDESDDGADRKTKKTRKKEQRERRAKREERRQAKTAQDERRAAAAPAAKATPDASNSSKKLSAEDYERLAAEAGISVKKFIRKYERGDVEVDEDGTPVVHSKKELKKARKTDDKSSLNGIEAIEDLSIKPKKRKHAEVAVEESVDGEAEVEKKSKKSKKEKKEKKSKA
jgi:nucleolar protein 58